MEYISILPSSLDLSSETQYLRLPHPRTGLPQLYLPTKEEGRDVILEVVKVQGGQRRSWFIGDGTIDAGTMLLHYPVDPLWLVIPVITHLLRGTSKDHPPPFQPLGDLISTAVSSASWALPPPFTKLINGKAVEPEGVYNADMERLLKIKSVRRVFRMGCERKVVHAGPPSPPASPSASSSAAQARGNVYYRPSSEAVLRLLRRKLEHVAAKEQFEMFDHLVRGLSKDGLLADGVAPELIELARLKAAGEHLSQWLHSDVAAPLMSGYDFATLNDHLANRAAAAAAANAPITQSKKAGSAAGEKRKAPAASRGVEVNTNSMAKLTSFFKPKDGKK